MTIFVEQHSYQNFTLSTIIGNQRFHWTYIGYSLKEAKKLFTKYVTTKLI